MLSELNTYAGIGIGTMSWHMTPSVCIGSTAHTHSDVSIRFHFYLCCWLRSNYRVYVLMIVFFSRLLRVTLLGNDVFLIHAVSISIGLVTICVLLIQPHNRTCLLDLISMFSVPSFLTIKRVLKKKLFYKLLKLTKLHWGKVWKKRGRGGGSKKHLNMVILVDSVSVVGGNTSWKPIGPLLSSTYRFRDEERPVRRERSRSRERRRRSRSPKEPRRRSRSRERRRSRSRERRRSRERPDRPNPELDGE